MQFPKLLIIIPVVLFATGCIQTRSLTEEFIKTKVEDHVPGTNSTIRTYAIYQSPAGSSTEDYIELTGYKYNGVKGMVVGADRYYRYRAKLTGLPVEGADVSYVLLSETECRTMLEKEPVIWTLLREAPRAFNSEVAYQDYTVNDRVFMSYRKGAGQSSSSYIGIWVDGHKYNMPSQAFTRMMRKFLNY